MKTSQFNAHIETLDAPPIPRIKQAAINQMAKVIDNLQICAPRAPQALPGEFFGPSQQRFLRVAFANVESDVIASLSQRLPNSKS